jgi:Xaa-Pro aminopeptidase
LLTGGALAAGTALGGRFAASAAMAAEARDGLGAGSAKLFLPPDDFPATTADRLDLAWSRERMRTLQSKMAERDLKGVLLTDRWNVIYFTGLWHTTTERMIYAFIPVDGAAPIWFYPALDRDLIENWWFEDGETYFYWHHAEGGFPHLGKVKKGSRVDLWEWALEGLKKRGFAKEKIATDRELTPSAQKTVVNVLESPMEDAGDICINMRMRKTDAELRLTRRAYQYFDKIHAFARDFILTHGTDLTDYDIASAAEKYGTDLVLADIKRDGAPHTAVGVSVGVSCRAGQATGYPHPNQFHHNKVERGQALQVAGVVRIGGCGGELYRPYMIAPRTDHMEKVWTVTRDACLMQKDLSRAGTPCQDVAYEIHKFQVGKDVQKYIYHRPAHGEGMEGHQPPYLALGDETVLDPGMCFSVEPGLFDPETGTGANFSDMFTVMPEGPALQMSRLPWSEEWAWIKI